MKLGRLIGTVLLVATIIAQQVVIHDLDAQRERSMKQTQDALDDFNSLDTSFNSLKVAFDNLKAANNKNEQTIKSLMETLRKTQ